tara:strand:+ start:9863 stop:12856 length:2994 start_codon:yes stop_codon:yes gene_type:complete
MSRPTYCTASEALVKLADLYDDFTGPKSNAYKHLTDPKGEFRRFVELELGVDIDAIKFMASAGNLTKGDVRGLKIKLDEHIKNLESGELPGSVEWYVPAAFAKKDPSIYKTLNNLQRAGFKDQARRLLDSDSSQILLDSVKKEAELRAISTPGLFDSVVKKYFKPILGLTPQQKHNKYTKLKRRYIAEAKAGIEGSAANLEKFTKLENELIKGEPELGVFNDLKDVIENILPKVIAAENKIRLENHKKSGKKTPSPENQLITNLSLAGENFDLKNTKKDFKGNKVVVDLQKLLSNVKIDNKDLSAPMKKALTTYIKLMDRAHDTLVDGVRSKIKTLNLKNNDKKTEDKIKEFTKKMEEKLLPDFEAGFFPHFVEDLTADFWAGIMPLFDDLNIASNNYEKKSHGSISIDKALDNIDGYMSDHAKKRANKRSYDHSPNFMLSVSDYLNDVNKFNFISFVDRYHAEALRSIEKRFKETNGNLNGYAQKIAEFVTDMHNTATGRNDVDNPQVRGFLRTALGFEFVSKMGINVRSAAKNATQRLIDYTQWSRQMIKDSNAWWDGEGRAEIAVGYGESADPMKVLSDLGIGFAKGMSPELLESTGIGGAATKTAQFNKETGKVNFVETSKMEGIADVVSNVGSVASGIHRAVENRNRAATFKIAYYQMWKWLNVPDFLNKYKSTDVAKNAIHRKAESYALKMTVAHHFDYNDFSKAKILTRPMGKLVGQFQHFAFSFYELSYNLARKSKNDLLEGEIKGQNALKAYRYATIYFLAPVLAAMATGINLDNLVDNNIKNTLKQWHAWLFGDDEEKEAAFYGKDPVTSALSFPALETALKVGEAFEVINLDEDGMLGMFSSFQDSSNRTGDEDAFKKLRILNTSLARAFDRTLPALSRGQLGWALQSELGLYPSKEARKLQEDYGYRADGKRKRKKKKSITPSPYYSNNKNVLASIDKVKNTTNLNKYDKFQRQNIMKAFDLIKQQQLEEEEIYNVDNNRKMTIS